jgi:hypothetical protein
MTAKGANIDDLVVMPKRGVDFWEAAIIGQDLVTGRID